MFWFYSGLGGLVGVFFGGVFFGFFVGVDWCGGVKLCSAGRQGIGDGP